MKTSELTGAKLDYWVARAENAHVDGATLRLGPVVYFCAEGSEPPSFCSDWNLGGPIIEREGISLEAEASRWRAAVGDVFSGMDDRNEPSACSGPTPLIAAMRAYVASKFGEEVG